MPRTIPSTPVITDDQLAALREQYPDIDIDAVVASVRAAMQPKRLSQETVAADCTDLGAMLSAAFPGLADSRIGAHIRAGYRGECKLTQSFDRALATNLKARKSASSARPTKAKATGRTSPATPQPYEKDNAATSAGSTAPALDNSPADTSASTESVRLQDASGAQCPVQLSLHEQRSDHRFGFTGTFAGQVYKTGVPEIGLFFDAIRKRFPDAAVLAAARAIQASEKAVAVLTQLDGKDRAIFDAAAAAMRR